MFQSAHTYSETTNTCRARRKSWSKSDGTR